MIRCGDPYRPQLEKDDDEEEEALRVSRFRDLMSFSGVQIHVTEEMHFFSS